MIDDAERRAAEPGTIGLDAPVVWLTGLSGSGKSAIGRALSARLAEVGAQTEYLDGDTIRDLMPQTGFSREERDAHVIRVGFLASRVGEDQDAGEAVAVADRFVRPPQLAEED